MPEAGLTNASTGLLEATLSEDRVLYVVEESPMHAGVIESISEDVVSLFDQVGVQTGVDLRQLRNVGLMVEKLLGVGNRSWIARSGTREEFMSRSREEAQQR